MKQQSSMAADRRQRKAIDSAIDEIVRRRCQGITISIMRIGDVFRAGYAAVAAGKALEPAIVLAYREAHRLTDPSCNCADCQPAPVVES